MVEDKGKGDLLELQDQGVDFVGALQSLPVTTSRPNHSEVLLPRVRNRILAGAIVVLVVVALTHQEEVRRGVYQAGFEMIEQPGIRDALLSMVASGLEFAATHDTSVVNPDLEGKYQKGIAIEKNEQYRPLLEMIQEGVEEYEATHDSTVVYERSVAYRDYDYYKVGFQEAVSQEGSVKDVTTERFVTLMPEEARSEWDFGLLVFSSFSDCVIQGSGFYDRVYEQTGLGWDEVVAGLHGDVVNPVARGYLIDMQQYVESEVERNGGQPISASRILAYTLDRNNGDLAKSLWDTAIFLKFMARANLQALQRNEKAEFTGFDQRAGENTQWFVDNILDEYGKVNPYTAYVGQAFRDDINPSERTNFDQNTSLVNLIGEPYHVWQIAAYLDAFPPEIVNMFVGLNMYSTKESQGESKIAADMWGLVGLSDLDQYLQGNGK